MSRLVVVGSGTVVPEAHRGCACFYLETGDRRVLLDCGPGVVQGLTRAGADWDAVSDLCVTHFHGDHVGGLPGFLWGMKHGTGPARAERPLTVWGPPGTAAFLDRLAAAVGGYVLDPGFELRVRELEPGTGAGLGSGVELRAAKTPHTDESMAYRLEGDALSLGYTGDTGPEAALETFFRAVGVLIAECSLPDEEVGDNHLSPGRVARLAQGARPELLLLTHIYPHLRRRRDVAALVRAAGYGGRLQVVDDGFSCHPGGTEG